MSAFVFQISTLLVDLQVAIKHPSACSELSTCKAVLLAGECATRCQSDWHSSCPDTPTEIHHAVSPAVNYFKGCDFVSGRLTKKHLMKMPTGSYLVSTLATDDGERVFGEFVATSTPERDEQWGRIVSVNADRYPCCVYKAKDVYDAFRLHFG